MSDLLFLDPVFKEKSWGGDSLRNKFEYELPSDHIGEAWVISGHKDVDLVIKNGKFKHLNLGSVYQKNRNLFNHLKKDHFPFLVRLLDVNEDLPIEVHTDVAIAYYILDAKKDATIILGHSAKTKDELKEVIEQNKLDEIVIHKTVKKGDFIYVPAGTLYGLKKGLLLMELGLSSGKSYESTLHMKEFMKSVAVPYVFDPIIYRTFLLDASKITQYVDHLAFSVEKWEIRDVLDLENKGFKMMSVISGKGFINGTKIKKGEHFIILSDTSHIQLEGNMGIIVSYLHT